MQSLQKAGEGLQAFPYVFRNAKLSDKTLNTFKDGLVRSVRFNKSSGELLIEMNLPYIINEDSLVLAEDELKKILPFINRVVIDVHYDLKKESQERHISDYWNNLIFHMKRKSPLCASLLEEGAWRLDKNLLQIQVKHQGAYTLHKRGFEKIISKLLNRRFSWNLNVAFLDSKEKPDAKAMEQIRREREDKIRQEIILSTDSKAESCGSEPFIPPEYNTGKKAPRKKIKLKEKLKGELQPLDKPLEISKVIVVEGNLHNFELRETKSGRYLITFELADQNGAVTVKFFAKPEEYTSKFSSLFKKGSRLMVKGSVQYDTFSEELNIMAAEICQGSSPAQKLDKADEKRVELHLHTNMSAMDAINSAKEYIKRAEAWGHKAVAITDHGIVQAFPEAMDAAKGTGVKVIYGLEAYLIDDLGAVVQCPMDKTLDETYVVFDLETTGLQKETDKIIEIGAVKITGGQIADTYSAFINPGQKLTPEITKLTSITDDMLEDAPDISSVLPGFIEFAGDAVLVAHNASFDVGFVTVAAGRMGLDINNTVLDTLGLSRTLFPELGKHKLDVVAKYLGVSLENHHRAVDDAKATAEIFLQCLSILREQGIEALQDINLLAGESMDKKKLKYYHAIILAKNAAGLKNLYELVSLSHLNYFARRPRIPKSEYLRLKEGLLIGTACEAGEFYKAVLENKPEEYIRQLAEFYDYFEIQPVDNNMYLVREGLAADREALLDINKKIVSLGEKFGKPVVATCDVHFIDPEGECFRRIIMAGDGFKDADLQAPLYYRTTGEMLEEFKYLGEEKAKEVVITNTNKIADAIEELKPIPDETFPPKIDGAEEELREISMDKAHELYGESLPPLVADRMERELNSIIKNGFAVMYIIAQKLVWKSMEDGYLVGSRGSVGSSFVATMAGITEVNPLPPHYRCPVCKYSDFNSEKVREYAGASGCDMPDAACPHCGAVMDKDGHDIPFETFLGFDGDKEPDIDLNFSGEYQAKAHAYTEVLFGEGNVFKAGTIGTLADKTAYGYVKKYLEERNTPASKAEVNRLIRGLTGIKRTTGQHPGGLMILPEGHSIYEFCPVQRPANDVKSTVTTTHFDYHSISGRLLKLDLLGHDVPTIIRMLHDTTGVDPQKVPLGDHKVMSLFTSPKALEVTQEDINCQTGTLGLPEFGTSFVRQMLVDTQPNSFAELVRISGLSHGTDVWFNNAQELIKEGTATLKEVIPTRDDIMVYLINKGVEKKAAFKIMENVRKGKGLRPDEVETMKQADVPDWYIESCRRIKYMFPKGHAVAYVMMTVRIGYFKIHYPYSFYAASFSVKAEDIDYEVMCQGNERLQQEMKRIHALGKEASAKDKNVLSTSELVMEFYVRGLEFVPLDLYQAQTDKFTVTEHGLMPPLCTIQGLGMSVAQNIVNARGEGEFFTIEEFQERTKANKSVLELLRKNNVFGGIPETAQMTLC